MMTSCKFVVKTNYAVVKRDHNINTSYMCPLYQQLQKQIVFYFPVKIKM